MLYTDGRESAPHTRRRPSRVTRAAAAGFTLVELLVVIGIIAVLVGILLPTLNRARQSANAVKCMSNLRQIGQGMHLYVQQNKGLLPFGFVVKGDPIQGGTYNGETTDWTTLLMNAMSRQKGGDYVSQDLVTTGADAGVRSIFFCPEAQRDSTSKAFVTHYSAHPRILPDLRGEDYYSHVSPNPIPRLTGYKMARIRHPAEKMAIFDASLSNSNYMAFACAYYLDRNGIGRRPYLTDVYSLNTTMNPNQPVDVTPKSGNATHFNTDSPSNEANIRFRHRGDTQANGLMLDGHVESFSVNKNTKVTDLLRKNIFITPPK